MTWPSFRAYLKGLSNLLSLLFLHLVKRRPLDEAVKRVYCLSSFLLLWMLFMPTRKELVLLPFQFSVLSNLLAGCWVYQLLVFLAVYFVEPEAHWRLHTRSSALLSCLLSNTDSLSPGRQRQYWGWSFLFWLQL